MTRLTRSLIPLLICVSALGLGAWPTAALAATAPGLGAAANFAVLADGTGLTCTDSNVTGPVGVSTSSTAVTSTRCKMQVQVAAGAYADFISRYKAIAGGLLPCDVISGTLAGLTLGPGIYCFPAAATLTGTLTLTGTGPWLFEIGTLGTGALTATNFTVIGGNPCNAFWWVRQDVTLTTSAFQGTVLGGGDITLTGTSLAGRALATGAVTMTGSNIFGCNAAGTVARHHCNQGVGNGPEGCDPGNSNQGNPNRSNDELGGTPGNPGRQGGNRNGSVEAKGNSNLNSNGAASERTDRVMASQSSGTSGVVEHAASERADRATPASQPSSGGVDEHAADERADRLR